MNGETSTFSRRDVQLERKRLEAEARREALNRRVAEMAEIDQKKALENIEPGNHPSPFVRAMGGGMEPRQCATPGCPNKTEGAEIEPRIPTPFIDACDAVMGYFSRYCEACVVATQAEIEAQAKAKLDKTVRAARLAWWQNVWGGPTSKYHDTDLAKIPDRQAAEKALRWRLEHPKGLVLIGDSGAGKTRTAYLLLRRILLEQGVRPMIKKCAKLRHEIAAAAKSDDEKARPALMKAMIEAPLLFLDDLGQMNPTDSLGEALFDVIEERTQLGRPIIATTQIGGDDLIEKFRDQKQGLALSRRLADHCYKIHFTRENLPSMEDIPPFTLQ